MGRLEKESDEEKVAKAFELWKDLFVNGFGDNFWNLRPL